MFQHNETLRVECYLYESVCSLAFHRLRLLPLSVQDRELELGPHLALVARNLKIFKIKISCGLRLRNKYIFCYKKVSL